MEDEIFINLFKKVLLQYDQKNFEECLKSVADMKDRLGESLGKATVVDEKMKKRLEIQIAWIHLFLYKCFFALKRFYKTNDITYKSIRDEEAWQILQKSVDTL